VRRVDTDIAIVGGGLAGSLLAILLARRGYEIRLFERGPGFSAGKAPGGRTINLALAARGLQALAEAGVRAAIEDQLLPMSGRIIHAPGRATRTLPYGQSPAERIFSVSRGGLNRTLHSIAADQTGIRLEFGCECLDYDPESGQALIRSGGGDFELAGRLLVAADGAGSVIRRSLAAAGGIDATEDLLDHGYKELTIGPAGDGDFAMAADGLHIWPRGGFMLAALPNPDRTFTATLFLPRTGPASFAALADNPRDFFAEHFDDASVLLPDLEDQVARNPVGTLGTIRCAPWHHATADRHCVLIGDAAHAVVPFHGQGINAGFEDCRELAALIDAHGPDWPHVLAGYDARRKPNADAIADMSLENYYEMRDGVRDPQFERLKSLGFELERRSGGRFIPRYSMVMFHPEIPYADAQRRGRIQDGILRRAAAGPDDDIDLALELIGKEL